MADSINVGILQALLEVNYDPAKLAVFLDQLTTAKAKQIQAGTETDRLKSAFNRLAASLDPVVAREQKYAQAIDIADRSLKRGIITQEQYNRVLAQSKDRLQDTTNWTQRLGSEISGSLKSSLINFAGPAAIAAGITAALASIWTFTKDVIKAAGEAETSQKKVEAIVDRVGNTSGITSTKVLNLAESLSKLSGKDDELLAESAAIITRFNRIGEEIFPRVSKAALDMAAATGDSLPSAFEKAARYVNLPVESMTRLKREGYAVSASQAELVKDFARTGEIAKAQEVVLSILEQQYGGAAASMRDSMGGAFEALGTSWENLQEKLGESNIGPLRDGVESLIKLLELLTESIDKVSLGYVSLVLEASKANLAIAKGLQFVGNASTLGALGQTDAVKNLSKEVADLDQKEAKLLLKLTLPPGATQFLGDFAKGHKQASRAALEQTESEKKLGNSLHDVEESIRSLEQAYTSIKAQRDAFARGGPKALQEEQDKQAAIAAVQKIQNSLRKEGLGLSTDQVRRIQEAVIGEREVGRELQALQHAYQLIGKLAYEPVSALEKSEEQLKKNMPLYLQWQEYNKINVKLLNDYSARLDLIGKKGIKNVFDVKIPVELYQKVANLIDQAANDEERRARAIADSVELMKLAVSLGITDPTTANETTAAIARQNANPLFTSNEQALYDFRQEIIDQFGLIISPTKTKIDLIKKAFAGYEDDLDLMAVKERALAAVRQEAIDNQLSAWQNFFSTLSSLFGGFGSHALQIAGDLVSRYQQISQAGSQLSALGGLAGSFGSYVSAAAPFLSIITTGISLQKQSIANQKLRRYTSSAELGIGTGDFSTLGRRGQELADAAQSALQPFLDLLGSTLRDLPGLAIQAREDGKYFEVTFGNAFLGVFETLQQATDALVQYSLEYLKNSSYISETMKKVIDSIPKGQDSAQILKDLNFADWYDNIGLGDLAARIKEDFRKMQQALDDASRLGLSADKIKQDYENKLLDIKASLFGVDQAASKALTNLIGVQKTLQDISEQERASAQRRLESAQSELQELIARGPRVGPGGFRQSDEEFQREVDKLQEQVDRYTAELDKIPQALSDQEIDLGIFTALEKYIKDNPKYAELAHKYAKMRVQIEFDLIKLKLIELGKWEEWAGVFNDIYQSAINAADAKGGKGGRGGGKSGDKQSARDFATDRAFQLALSKAGEYSATLMQINHDYDEQIKAAGKDKKLKEELLALRAQEIAQARKEYSEKLDQSFREFMGLVTPFDEIKDRAKKLVDAIKDSPYGDERKAKMISRVMSELDHQLDRLSKQTFVGLAGNLANDMAAFGATETQQFEIRKAQAILEHELKVENYRVEVEKLKVEGRIAPAMIEGFEKALNWFASQDPTKFIPGGGGVVDDGRRFKGYGDDVVNTVNNIGEALKNAQDLLQKYKDQGLDPYHAALRDLDKDFDQIFAQLGRGPEVMTEYNEALARINEEYSADLREFYGDLRTGPYTSDTIDQQFASALSNWEKLSTAIKSGDLSKSSDYREEGQRTLDLLSKIGGTTSKVFGDLRDRITGELEGVLGISSTQSPQQQMAALLSDNKSISSNILSVVSTTGVQQVSRLDSIIGRLDNAVDTLDQILGAALSTTVSPINFG